MQTKIYFKKYYNAIKKVFNTRYLGLIITMAIAFNVEAAFAQNNLFLTWNEAIDQALKENQQLAAAQSNLEVQNLDVKIARANFLPSLHFSGSYLPSQGTKINDWDRLGVGSGTQGLYSAGINQMIYNESFFADHKIQKNLYGSQQEKYRSSQYQIITTAGQAYINVLMAADMFDIQIDNLKLTSKNLQSSKDREAAGVSSHREVLRWETKLYTDEQKVVEKKANVVINRVAFNQILNKPEEDVNMLEKLTIEKNGFIFSNPIIAEAINDENKARIIRDYLVELGLLNYPDLVSMDWEIAANERQLKSYKRWAIPNFSLLAGADELFLIKNDDAGNAQKAGLDFWFVGASVKWNIFKGGSNFSKITQSKWQVKALNSQKNNLAGSIEQYIRSNVATAISFFQKIAFAQAQNITANQNYNEVLDAYYVGETTLLDLLDAQEQKISSDITVKTTMYSFFASLLAVEQAIGYFHFLEPPDSVQTIMIGLENRLTEN